MTKNQFSQYNATHQNHKKSYSKYKKPLDKNAQRSTFL